LRSLQEIAERAGANLRLVTRPESLDALGEVLGRGDRIRFMSRVMHREMMREVRWSEKEALASRDGLDIATLELTPTDEAGMRLISDWSVMAAVHDVGGGLGLATSAKKHVAAACAVGLLTLEDPARESVSTRYTYVRGGIALQRVWLLATKLGLAFHPMTALTYLFTRLEEGKGAGLDERDGRELVELRRRYREVFELTRPATELMVFRLAVASPPTARSLRRKVSEMLEVEGTGRAV
jgi:hypothetical protein